MKQLKVLLVDDDEVDYMNVKRAFKMNQLIHIVVYILTTTSQDSDISKAYEKQLSGYLLKPLDFDDFREKLNSLWGIQKFSNDNK
jgi:DNA-binding NarL/FixJ family response regulator